MTTEKTPSSFPFICFDTEDDSKELLAAGKSGFDKTVTQIAAITAEGKRYYNKGNVPEFLKWLQRQPEKFVYAHNLQYDLGNLFGDKLDTFDATLVGGRLIKAVWGKKIFVDSFNIWPMSAKKLGEAFGLEKLATASMATDREYVFRDVEIIRRAMLFAWQFVEHLDLTHLPPTLGGLCVKVWRHFGGANCHDSSELSRAALYGGRVELFKVCNDSRAVCWTDINSLYPYVMKRDYPGPLEAWTRKRLPRFGVVRCVVKQPKTDLPVLPFRGEDGRILYPWGTFQGVWTVEELNYAVSRGAKIIKRLECLGTDESMTPYGNFVDKLYETRLASTSAAEKLFFKLLMNNLYGRLAASGKIGRTVWQTEKNRLEGVPYGDKVLVNYQMPLADETNWCHAAYVTAYGRMELHRYLVKIGASKMIYCDTDSCVFDCPGKQIPFAVGSDLGQMKLEGWEKIAVTYAPKMYRIGKRYKAKGVPVRLAREFIASGHAEFDLPFKLREAIRFFDQSNRKKLSVWRKVVKTMIGKYDRKKLKNNRYFPCQVYRP